MSFVCVCVCMCCLSRGQVRAQRSCTADECSAGLLSVSEPKDLGWTKRALSVCWEPRLSASLGSVSKRCCSPHKPLSPCNHFSNWYFWPLGETSQDTAISPLTESELPLSTLRVWSPPHSICQRSARRADGSDCTQLLSVSERRRLLWCHCDSGYERSFRFLCC